MASQLGALREALVDAGAAPDKAQAAAEEVATYEREVADLKGSLRLVTTTQTVIISLIVLSIGGQFAIWSKLGELSARLAH